MSTKKVASAFQPRERRRVQKVFKKPSRTKQQFKSESDVNNILKKYGGRAGVQHFGQTGIPMYGDFSEVPDYQTALNRVRELDDVFGALSARVRERFNNDPAEFMAFAASTPDAEKLKEYGLTEVLTPPPGAPPVPGQGTEAGTEPADPSPKK